MTEVSARVLRTLATIVAATGLCVVTALSIAPSSVAGASLVWGTPAEVPNGGGIFFGVSCPGTGECTAVGLDASQPTAATETGGVWGTGTEVPGTISGGAEFIGVSCTGAGECTAVGNDNDNNVNNSRAIAATESGGVWGTASEVSASSDAVDFRGVSCTGAGECTAVGDDSSRQPITATESGSVWGTATEVPSPLAVDFTGVSCTGAVDCTAVGYDMNGQPVYATETAGTWGTVSELTGSLVGSTFAAVSCSGVGECTAVGANNNGQPTYATETGGVWGTVTKVSGSPSGGSAFLGVSCSGVGECTAVGKENTVNQPIAATETGGAWGKVTKVSGSPGGEGAFGAVSCSGAGSCTAVGFDGNGRAFYASSVVAPPKITGFTPTSGPVGTAVTITGSNLDGATAVSFNGVNGIVTRNTAAKIKVKVPAGATKGKITVVTPGGTAKTATAFKVT
jgi:hypothetical protein